MFAHFVGQFDDHMVFSSHSLSQQCNLLSYLCYLTLSSSVTTTDDNGIDDEVHVQCKLVDLFFFGTKRGVRYGQTQNFLVSILTIMLSVYFRSTARVHMSSTNRVNLSPFPN